MDLRKQLLKTHSKENTALITEYVALDAKRFDALMKLFLYDEYRVVQRAAWAVGNLCKETPTLASPYLAEMVENLKKPGIHDAVKRNTLRFMQDIDMPEALWGQLAEICFELLSSMEEAVAIKVFAMTVLFNIVKEVPELKEELQYAIEDQLPYGSAGFKSRGNKILKGLQRL